MLDKAPNSPWSCHRAHPCQSPCHPMPIWSRSNSLVSSDCCPAAKAHLLPKPRWGPGQRAGSLPWRNVKLLTLPSTCYISCSMANRKSQACSRVLPNSAKYRWSTVYNQTLRLVTPKATNMTQPRGSCLDFGYSLISAAEGGEKKTQTSLGGQQSLVKMSSAQWIHQAPHAVQPLSIKCHP